MGGLGLTHHHWKNNRKDHSEKYDWESRQVDLPLISFNGDQLDHLEFICGCGCKEIFGYICKFLKREGIEEYAVECFLSDKSGHPLKLHKAISCGALLCKEMEQACGRRDVEVRLPNGKIDVRQVVKVLVKGYVGVNVVDDCGNVICKTSKGIPFATVETFYLCAPRGTHLDCDVSFFECDASLLCKNKCQTEFQQLDLSISLCLDVRMVANNCCHCHHKCKCNCHRRREVETITVCPERKFPPHCPQIFPAHK
jgi:hypothetical protein